jgi:hypothetical protein
LSFEMVGGAASPGWFCFMYRSTWDVLGNAVKLSSGTPSRYPPGNDSGDRRLLEGEGRDESRGRPA